MTIVDVAEGTVVGRLPIGPNYDLIVPATGAAYNTNRSRSEVLAASNGSTVVINTATQEISAILPYSFSGSGSGVALAGDQLYTIGFYSGFFQTTCCRASPQNYLFLMAESVS
jgi:hypothetical protein